MRGVLLLAVALAALGGCTGTMGSDTVPSLSDGGASDATTAALDATSSSADAGSMPTDSAVAPSDSSVTPRDMATTAPDSAVPGGSCSPSATPVGVEACQYAPNVTLYDCAGNPVELHSLCDVDISYVYTFAHWCPNCRTFAMDGANDLYAEYRESIPNFEMFFVITQTQTYQAPTAADCVAIRDQYSLTMPVLYDRDDVLFSVFGMRRNTADMVIRAGGKIVINGPWAEFTARGAIEGGYGECLAP